jgi:competence protein ComEC
MPLLIHATGWWIAGLLVGALLGARSGRDLAASPWFAQATPSPMAAMLGVMLLVGSLWAVRRRHAGRSMTSVSCVAIGIAGIAASVAATSEARLCRRLVVEALTSGRALPVVYDGAMADRERAVRPAGKTPPPARGRGRVRLTRGDQQCRVPASLRWPRAMPTPLRAGDVAAIRGRAMATERGVRIDVDSVQEVTGRDWLRVVRGRAGDTIDRLFDEQSPLVRALVIADQDGIATDVRDRFADAGLVHMLSVSGMHVAIIASALLTISGAMRLPTTVGAFASLLLILAYVATLGAPAPAVRSAVMLLTVMLSSAWQRPLHEWTALALGATIPTVQPLIVLDLGWQLSVSGMAALVAARAMLRRWHRYAVSRPASSRAGVRGAAYGAVRGAQRWLVTRRGVSRWLVRETITGGVATLVTAPLIAWTFGRVSLLAPITNLLAGPVVAFLQPALFLALLVSPVEPLAQLIADASTLPIALLDRIARVVSSWPFAVLHVAPTLLAALGAGVASMAVVRATAARRAGGWLRLAAASLTAAVWLPVWSPPLGGSAGMLEVHMIDVGQGDAFALRTPRGRWVLLDAGPSWDGGDAGRRAVVPYVQRIGGAVALLVLSHAHEDHVGGAASVITALDPQQWWEPAFVTSSSGYRRALVALRERGRTWRRVQPGQRWQLDGVVIDVLAPDSAWTAAQHDANETSVVLRVSFGVRRFLFMGDAESREEAWLVERLPAEALQADVLKLGHHGSRTSSGADFLRAVDPLVGLVSVGAGNRYGHPSPEILERFAAIRVPLLRSDLEGGVVLRTDGRMLEAIANGDRWLIPSRTSVR